MSIKESVSHRTIQKQLDAVEVKKIHIQPQEIVATVDVTFFQREYGILVFRSSDLKTNIYWKEVESETTKEYVNGRAEVEALGL